MEEKEAKEDQAPTGGEEVWPGTQGGIWRSLAEFMDGSSRFSLFTFKQ